MGELLGTGGAMEELKEVCGSWGTYESYVKLGLLWES